MTKNCIRTFVSAIVVVVVVAVVVVVVVIGRRRGYRMSLGRRRRRRRRRRCRRVDALARKEIVTFERRPPTGCTGVGNRKKFCNYAIRRRNPGPRRHPRGPRLPGKLLAPGQTACSRANYLLPVPEALEGQTASQFVPHSSICARIPGSNNSLTEYLGMFGQARNVQPRRSSSMAVRSQVP